MAIEAWFRSAGWSPFEFQRETWCAMAEGKSGLLHATTGSGKTLALGFGGWLASEGAADGIKVLWVTPMRALAADTERALASAFETLGFLDASGRKSWRIGARTGDTPSHRRTAQTRKPPDLLVTTPESLTLMLSRSETQSAFSSLRCVIVDEWHELMGNKRGVQTQLALARLRRLSPRLMTWGMSATIGNLFEAKDTLLGVDLTTSSVLIQARVEKLVVVDTLLPTSPELFPWAGHLGLKMAGAVVAEVETSGTTLIFTNTRSQAELWYQALLKLRPDWAGILAVHHGSMERDRREWVERGLREGSLKAVVCTSSLDLGVDFLPVERVLQIGSPKGVARLLQRAGRSGHAPGRLSRVTIVPSHNLELVEAAAVKTAIAGGRIEGRVSPRAPLDVLAQHCVTMAVGGGFRPSDLLAEVRTTAAYAELTDENWLWCLDFISRGGPSLTAYPDFRRVVVSPDGIWRVPDKAIALRHKLNIGAIVSDAAITLQFGPAPRGAKLGTVEESFIARLKPGGKFWFSGRLLEFVRLNDSTAFVRPGKGGGATPRWQGGRLPLSTTLADEMVEALERAARGDYDGPEMQAAKPMLELQRKWSALPTTSIVLAETLKTRDGWHLFLYPFGGREVHVGLAGLLAWRSARKRSGTFSISVNDYGFELLSAAPRDWAADLAAMMAPAANLPALAGEITESLNAGELARRRFRDIAHISGLVVSGYPKHRKTARMMQASSNLFYDVFRRFDPENRLLDQAEREVLADELDVRRMSATLDKMAVRRLDLHELRRPSPLAFPLMVARLREKLSNETLATRVERMVARLNRVAAA